MTGDLKSLEPAYSNLIEHFDMKGVKAPVRFIADCIRYAKAKGIGDAQLELVFLESVADISQRQFKEGEAQTVERRFQTEINKLRG